MAISIAGVLVCGTLLLLGRLLGAPVIIGLFASLAFGATGIANVGGSTPLIYTMFELLLLASAIVRLRFVPLLGVVFRRHWVPWLVLALLVYVVAGALILPRLFASEATVFVPNQGNIVEVPLAPVAGNFNQAAYFALGAATFYAFAALLLERDIFGVIGRGFMVYAALQVTLGFTDLGGKIVGLGDVLAPLRSAGYVMHTETAVAGFWRIAGGFSEASAFAGSGVTALAFVFTYWRATGSAFALILTVSLFGLLLFSTSTTAYVALAILFLPLLGSLIRSTFANGLSRRELALVGMVLVSLTVLFALYLWDERPFEPFVNLVNSMVFEKQASSSGVERAYWNSRSLQAFFDSGCLGVGIGSSRSSSLIISILSQLGILGMIMFAILVGFLLRGMSGLVPSKGDAEMFCITRSARAAALASLVTSSIAGSGADPGIVVFIALALVMVCREHVECSRTGAHLLKTTGENPVMHRPRVAISAFRSY